MDIDAPPSGSDPPRRVLLDTQQWNYLVEPGHGPQPFDALARLEAAQDHGLVEVVGSLHVLQELIEAAPRASTKSKHMIDLFLGLTANRLLLPLDRRHDAEVRSGGVLHQRSQYLPRSDRRQIARLARKRSQVLDIADTLHAEKGEFERGEVQARNKVLVKLEEHGGPPTPALMREWIAEVDIDEWVAEIASAGTARGRYSAVDASGGRSRFPSAWSFVAIRLAKLVHILGEGRKIRDSDLADAHHVACAPYIDLLVTDDRALGQAIDVLGGRSPVVWESSPRFFGSLPDVS